MVDTQKSLLIRAQRGSEDAWRNLVDLYRPLIHKWLGAQGVIRQESDDLSQDILTTLVERLSTFEHNGNPGAFRCWLRLMVVNRARAFWRARGYRPAAGLSEFQQVLDQLEDSDSDLSKRWDREHDDFVLRSILQTVNSEFESRTIQAFELLAISGQSAKEVAEKLGMSVGAVYVARSRVMRRVREEAAGLIDYQ